MEWQRIAEIRDSFTVFTLIVITPKYAYENDWQKITIYSLNCDFRIKIYFLSRLFERY